MSAHLLPSSLLPPSFAGPLIRLGHLEWSSGPSLGAPWRGGVSVRVSRRFQFSFNPRWTPASEVDEMGTEMSVYRAGTRPNEWPAPVGQSLVTGPMRPSATGRSTSAALRRRCCRAVEGESLRRDRCGGVHPGRRSPEPDRVRTARPRTRCRGARRRRFASFRIRDGSRSGGASQLLPSRETTLKRGVVKLST
jgi:hypothetical protein